MAAAVDMSEAMAIAASMAVQPRVDLWAAYCEVEAELVAAGFPATSPWWKATLRRFWASGKRRLVPRVGRRGGKSSTLCRVAVVELLYGAHVIQPGDVGVFAFFSVSMREARSRLRTVCEILDAIGCRYSQSGDDVHIEGLPLAISVYPASFRTAVGRTYVGAVYDELARWRDSATGANPATEVLRSTRPAMATQPHAHEYLSSSPFSTLDAHHEAVDAGETPEQCVAVATTWEANPTISEAECRRLEPDEQTFLREYGAQPMAASAAALFDVREIEAAASDYSLPRHASVGEWVTAGADFGFRRDSSALVVVHRGDAVWRVGDLLEMRPSAGAALRPSETVRAFAAQLGLHGVRAVMADAHYRESIVEHLEPHGIGLLDAPLDVPATYTYARSLLHDGRLRLPRHKQLLRDLAEVQAAPTATGRTRIILPRHEGGGHADLVSALVLALWQRGGVEVKPAVQTAEQRRRELEQAAEAHWTQEEKADVERLERAVRADRRGFESYISDFEPDWLTEG